MNEEFLRIKRIDTDTVVIPETNNKFEYHRLKDLLDEYYEWRVNKLNKSDVISSVCGSCLMYLTCNNKDRDKYRCKYYDDEP